MKEVTHFVHILFIKNIYLLASLSRRYQSLAEMVLKETIMKKNGFNALSLSVLLAVSSTSIAATENITAIDTLSGAALPYQILRNDLIDHAKPGNKIEIRNGGFGSDMTAHPSHENQFYALTDRGPNATYKKGQHGKGKIFPTPNYTPRIGLFEVNEYGNVELIKVILLKKPDGSPISGLPNSSDIGGTGETPYDTKGNPITQHPSKAFDPSNNPLKLDDYGLDGEGLVAMRDGTFWVSDEYGPHIVHFDQDGIEMDRINAFTHDTRAKFNLPAEYANRRPNRGMEGLAITPDETTLVGTMQSTMYNPDKKVKALDLARIVTINLETGKTGQYLYKQEKAQNSNSGIAAISQNEFVIIERDGAFYRDNPQAMKHIYRIDLAHATNLEGIPNSSDLIQDDKLGLMINGQTLEQAVNAHGWEVLEKYNIKPVTKSLVVDLVKEIKYPHDKLEGMWLIDSSTLGVINDDDFATWASKGKLEQKYLNKEKTRIDNNTLYIFNNLNLK